MNFDSSTLRGEELISLRLRTLYERYGYRRFKMGQFESYGLYMENKRFLASEQMITFTDLDGRLLALKPDVTLSIVKNARTPEGGSEKLYYIENIYRPSRESNTFREISQMGLEFIGAVELYGLCEVVSLALESLAAVGRKSVLELSHMGFVIGLLDALEIPEEIRGGFLSCIRSRNTHDLCALSENTGLSEEATGLLSDMTGLYGRFEEILPRAARLVRSPAMEAALGELAALYDALCSVGLGDNLRLGFSTINDIDYYSGVIFQGFVEGLPRSVLSGGQYDNLMRKFGRRGGAAGFAVYLSELAQLPSAARRYDCDLLIEYTDGASLPALMAAVRDFTAKGLRVRAEKNPLGLLYLRHYICDENGLREVP